MGSGSREEEINRMRDANNVKAAGGTVAKSLAVARSINFAAGGHHDKKYDFLFNDDEPEDETPRKNSERAENTTEPFDSARYGPNSTKKMLEPLKQDNNNFEEAEQTMPSSNYNKKKNSSKVRQAIEQPSPSAPGFMNNPFRK